MAQEENEQINEQKIQEAFQRMQLLQQLLESIGQNIASMEDSKMEILSLRNAISGLGKEKKNDSEKDEEESVVMLANGIFLKADIKDFDNFIVGVGNNILVKKNREQLMEFLKGKTDDLSSSIEELRSQYEGIANEFTGIYSAISQNDNDSINSDNNGGSD